jgi:hypothetical protein
LSNSSHAQQQYEQVSNEGFKFHGKKSKLKRRFFCASLRNTRAAAAE